jgi:hypothetical protein
LQRIAGESNGHLAWSTTELIETTERVVAVINSVILEAVMAMAMELNASIFKDANCLINIMVWGMRTGFR